MKTRRIEFLHKKETHFSLTSGSFDQCSSSRMDKLVSQAANKRIRFLAEKCNR